ncbi:histone-lysine N-methyltransferase SUVR5-like isoform X1 [Salvia hispanica]|uniref:histone-lysine N-methyltransferase SUVR5-like isoform X1 n=1 Tax=Salvia hispanica TaxID=49212 RepID=UPI002009BC65|nr:histone-lysine N-methyltransferase SUVR5-like isoform X1 [Salvia hispanica]
MEVLPCAPHVGESDCPKPEQETAFKDDGKSGCHQGSDYVRTDLKFDDLTLTVGESHEVREDGGQFTVEGFPTLNGGSNDDTYFDYDLDGQTLSCYSHDSEDNNFEKTDDFAEPCHILENSHQISNTIGGGVSSNHQEGSPHLEIKGLDEPQAVWVKWRGQWQSGIRCARADWPLSTLKAKPTHDRKQYLVIFFPHTRNYSWADVQLVRPIDEFPHPIAYKTHQVGIKMVKDLTLARRFIMQKLAVGMLNILDQLNREALIESARNVMVLKDFAMEASHCKDYSDLGKKLLKLQNMILTRCITSDWLLKSLESWKQRCHDANSAECIEMLKEELSDSILWNEVNLLSSEAAQLDGGSDWKSWKSEVMKWFSVSHPISTDVALEPVSDSPLTMELQTPKKRPKLEVRRADTHVSGTSGTHQPVPVETDASFFNGYMNSALLEAEALKRNSPVEVADLAGSTSCAANSWNDIVVEAGNVAVTKTTTEVDLTPSSVVTKFSESGNHNRQCMAFIEAKGRQCVRYASEGDVYCCVHLSSRFIGSSAKTEATPPTDSPMCGGTTVLGTKCKHRALIGSSFCKKHRPHDGKNISSPVNKLKRKFEENLMYPEGTGPTKLVLSREDANPAHLDPLLLDRGKDHPQESSVSEKTEQPQQNSPSDETLQCIGSWPQVGEPCLESPKRHSLYCDQHIPSWLKRARNGKSRIVSKEVFMELLKNCQSRERKLQLHHACELFYRLLKSILSLRNPVPKEVQFQWAIAEASKDTRVGEFLMKLVFSEKERLKKLWDFGDGQSLQVSSTVEDLVPVQVQMLKDSCEETVIKCKICSETLSDDQALGKHWIESHKKEAQWLFRGYVCAICLDSFTNRKILETHVQERHHVQFVEQCMLLQCIPCGSHFGNPDELWSHVLSVHSSNLRLSSTAQQQDTSSLHKIEGNMLGSVEHAKFDNQSVNRRFICRFCGLKFDLLPDLGRHHQAAHMGEQTSSGPRLKKKGIQFYAQKLKSGRLTRPGFKKALTSASYKIRNRSVQNLKKRIQASSSIVPTEIMVQPSVPDAATLGRLADSQCSAVAKLLISEIKKTKLRPNNSEILSIASSACCKVSLQASLEEKYGVLPERLYLKAAKLCSDHNIIVEWHRDDFICSKGCLQSVKFLFLSPLVPSSDNSFKTRCSPVPNLLSSEWTLDECHCVIDSQHFSMDLSEKNVILCDDISFGQEPMPIACVVDENILNAEGPDGQSTEYSFPWESFTYVRKPLLDESLVLESESLQLGCACAHSTCSSETCDHVYLFDNDYEDAKDIYGKPMHGRFPYDERGRIILEEGYLVYECNQRCSCSRACQNRVLQNGVQVRLEIFKTERKGWAVRARQAIPCGSFVCEYIGEVIDEKEANERRSRYSTEGCGYFYEIDARINDMSRLMEGQVSYVIDATNYGNVSRYINHSCSPNLVNHQVLIESMDSKLAHIGLYASRDIALGEELTYDFRYKLLPGEGCRCECGASNCRGRLY